MSKKDIIDYVMETPGNTNKKVLGRLIDEVEGVKLPEVTEDDNGSVLTVVEGTWDKAEPSGGSGGVPVFTAIGTYNNSTEGWDYALADDSPIESIIECATAGDPMFLRAINTYNTGAEEALGVYPVVKIYHDYPEPDYTPVVTSVDFGSISIASIDTDYWMQSITFAVNNKGAIICEQIDRQLN